MDNRAFVTAIISSTETGGHVFLAEVGRLDGSDYLLATLEEPNAVLQSLQQTLQQRTDDQSERCDDAIRLSDEQHKVGIACRSYTWLVNIVQRCGERDTLIGQQSVWAAGYWLPEALFGDLSIAQAVWGDSDQLKQLSHRLLPYPDTLAEGITSLCAEEIERKQSLSQSDDLAGVIARHDCAIARVRLLFATHRIYLRSLGNLHGQAAALPPPGREELSAIRASL